MRITISDIRAGRPLEVFRIVRSDDAGDPALLSSLRSNYELGNEPRRIERRWVVIHMGISTYSDERAAHGVAAKFEKLGGFVGRLWLGGDKGFNFARTSHPLHLTVWGEPIKLLESVIDIKPVK